MTAVIQSSNVCICLLGFGEVGQTLAADLRARNVHALRAWDTRFADPASGPSRAAASLGVRAATNPHEAAATADLIVSAVTAAQAIQAARSFAPHLRADAIYLDVNSVSPGTKQQAAALVEAGGARYVEAAIMSPIAPKRIASPMLLGGPHAQAFLPLARELGFDGTKVFSDDLGRASAAKMCRSVIVKGMEALLAESLLTARHYGVEQSVIDSLRTLFPAENWRTLARYMISRSLQHGRRRAEEMREVARTVEEAGFDPHMSTACAARQEWAGQYRLAAEHEELEAMLDGLLTAGSRAAKSSSS